MSDLKARTWGTGKQPYVIAAIIAAFVSVTVIKLLFPSNDSSQTPRADAPTTQQVGPGVLETAEFTIPIPAGYRNVSMAEARDRAKRKPPSDAVVVILESAGSGIVISRLPAGSSEGAALARPTSEATADCGRFAGKVAARGNQSFIAAATLVEQPPAGLGRTCQFTIGSDGKHMTQVITTEWTMSCLHSPGETAACHEVAAGFRRR